MPYIPPNPKERITLSLSEQARAALAQTAEARGTSVSALMEAIADSISTSSLPLPEHKPTHGRLAHTRRAAAPGDESKEDRRRRLSKRKAYTYSLDQQTAAFIRAEAQFEGVSMSRFIDMLIEYWNRTACDRNRAAQAKAEAEAEAEANQVTD